MRGIIACDIDGTLTVDKHSIPSSVADFLHSLSDNTWEIVFITGRTFTFAKKVLAPLAFPYLIAVQNGAHIIEMPKRQIVAHSYLPISSISLASSICGHHSTDLVVYGGFESGDRCFFRPQGFSHSYQEYISQRREYEVWETLSRFDDLPIPHCTSFKYFGPKETVLAITQELTSHFDFNFPIIKDPFYPGFYIAQATHRLADKGQALKRIANLLGNPDELIACGDDYNDYSMLAVANTRVVMETAPQELLDIADIIAPSAAKCGIIQALKDRC